MTDRGHVSCPLCGARFEAQAACVAGCPMSRYCSTLCCPACGYRFVDESRSLLARVVQRLLPGRSA